MEARNISRLNAQKSAGGFQASEIEPLEYSLKPYVDASGVVPEPTRKQQKAFSKRMAKLGSDAQLEGLSGSEEEQEQALQSNPDLLDELMEVSDHAEEELRAAVADLCNGSPTKDQIDELPPRIFMHFYRWLLAELNPEA